MEKKTTEEVGREGPEVDERKKRSRGGRREAQDFLGGAGDGITGIEVDVDVDVEGTTRGG